MNSILSKRVIFVCMIVAALALWGCSDDDGTPTNGGTPDTKAPEVSSVTATQVRSIDVLFSEAVDKTSAENKQNYLFSTVPQAGPPLPPDTLLTVSAILQADGKTVTATTDGDMESGTYLYYVSGVKDLSGNTMTSTATGSFEGNTDADNTPPEIVFNSPTLGQTGVDVSAPVVVQFSEPMQSKSVMAAFSLSNGGAVAVDMYGEAGNTYRFVPEAPLARDTEYTVVVNGNAVDMAGNALEGNPTWTFRTTVAADNTPPRLVSSVPLNNATNVDRALDIEFHFSEPITQDLMDDVIVTPDIGNGTATWSNGGASVSYNPDQDLAEGTQYTIVLPAGSVEDLAGNPMEESVTITFTTGTSIAAGRISGRLSGDSNSPDASNPAGAIVLASTDIIFEVEGPPAIYGTATATGSGSYNIQHLPDNTYYLAAILDSNDDGAIDPELGDAIGMYGANLTTFDLEPDSVVVSGGGNVTGKDFRLYDFSAVSGMVDYIGTDYADNQESYTYYVGLFVANGFDPMTDPVPEPDYNTMGDNMGTNPEYVLNQLDLLEQGKVLQDGTYYVGAYLDVGGVGGEYDEGVDPAGFYMVGGQPASVTLSQGSDVLGIDIDMDDPDGGLASSVAVSVVWGGAVEGTERSEQTRRLLKALKRALAEARRVE